MIPNAKPNLETVRVGFARMRAARLTVGRAAPAGEAGRARSRPVHDAGSGRKART